MFKKAIKNKFIGNIASLGIVNISNYLFPIITIPIVARALGPEKIGIINYMASFVSYFSLFVSYSFNITGTRRIARDPNNSYFVDKVFSEVFFAQLLLFIISTTFFFVSIKYFTPVRNENTLAWFSYLSCVGALFTQNWLFQAKQELKLVALLNLIPRIVITVFVVFFIRKESDYLKYAFIGNCVSLVIALLSFTWAKKRYRLKLYWVSIKQLVIIIKNDRVLFFSNVITSVYTTTGIIILGYFMPITQVGYYTSAQKLIDILRSVIIMPINQALFPITVKAFSEAHEKGINLLKNYLPLFIMFTFFIFLASEVLGPIIIKLLYGSKFTSSIPIFLILNVGLFFVFYGYFFGVNAMLTMGMDVIYVRIQIIVSVISLILTFIFVPQFGAMGTAFIWTLSECIVSTSQFYVLRKKGYRLIDKNVLTIKYYKTAVKSLNLFSKN